MTASPADIKHARDLLGWGLVLITVGLIRIVEGGLSFLTIWPYFVLASALAYLWHPDITSTGRRSWAGPLWLVYVAVWGMLTVHHAFGLNYQNAWPLLMIGGGVWLVWHGIENPQGCSGRSRSQR